MRNESPIIDFFRTYYWAILVGIVTVVVLFIYFPVTLNYSDGKICHNETHLLMRQYLYNGSLYMNLDNGDYIFKDENKILVGYEKGDTVLINLCFFPQLNRTLVRGIELYGR